MHLILYSPHTNTRKGKKRKRKISGLRYIHAYDIIGVPSPTTLLALIKISFSITTIEASKDREAHLVIWGGYS